MSIRDYRAFAALREIGDNVCYDLDEAEALHATLAFLRGVIDEMPLSVAWAVSQHENPVVRDYVRARFGAQIDGLVSLVEDAVDTLDKHGVEIARVVWDGALGGLAHWEDDVDGMGALFWLGDGASDSPANCWFLGTDNDGDYVQPYGDERIYSELAKAIAAHLDTFAAKWIEDRVDSMGEDE